MPTEKLTDTISTTANSLPSRRALLRATGLVGAGAAIGGGTTMAILGDIELFSTRMVAGELDMKAAWVIHYFDWSSDEFEGIPDEDVTMTEPSLEFGPRTMPGIEVATKSQLKQALDNAVHDRAPDITFAEFQDRDCEDLPDVDRPVIEITDVKNSDVIVFSCWFHLCDNDGYVWLTTRQRENAENGVNDPESDDPDENGGEPGELGDVIECVWWYDVVGDDILDPDDQVFFEGSLSEFMASASQGAGVPLDGDLETSFDEVGGDPTDPNRDCFPSSTVFCVTCACHVGEIGGDLDNEIQGDSLTVDVGFYTEQCRHNTGASQTEGDAIGNNLSSG